MVDEIYPLYLNVFARSPLQFEKLTKEFLAEIGARMPDKTLFFVWRQEERAVAFALCMVNGGDIYHEYVGFDYSGVDRQAGAERGTRHGLKRLAVIHRRQTAARLQ